MLVDQEEEGMVHGEAYLRGEGHKAHLCQGGSLRALLVHRDGSLVLQLRRHGGSESTTRMVTMSTKYLGLGLRRPSYPVDEDFFRGHPGEISTGLEQVGQAHLLEVLNQVVVLLQFEPRQHHFSSPAREVSVTVARAVTLLANPDAAQPAHLFVMFWSHLLTTVGEISCSRVLMPVSFLGRAMSMLMFPVYGSWKRFCLRSVFFNFLAKPGMSAMPRERVQFPLITLK